MPTIDSAGVSFDATVFGGHQTVNNEPGLLRYRANKWASIFFPKEEWLWTVSTSNFEEIHGMSRVLALMPEKLETSRELFEEEVVSDPGFPIRLLCGLAHQFASVALGKIAEDQLIRDCSQQEGWKYNIRSTDFQWDAGHPYPLDSGSLNDVFLQVIELLTECESLCNAHRADAFREKAKEALELGKATAEACAVYLKVIHPALINLNKNNQLDWNVMETAETRLKAEVAHIKNKMKA
jgi:hypothetical protein